MAHPSDVEARLSALEARVSELAERVQHSEQDAAAARVLAGGADRDVEQIRGEIRDFRQATTSSFTAMREDLTDLRERVDGGFVQVDRGFAEVRGLLTSTAAGLEQITGLLNTLMSQQSGRQPASTRRANTSGHCPLLLAGAAPRHAARDGLPCPGESRVRALRPAVA